MIKRFVFGCLLIGTLLVGCQAQSEAVSFAVFGDPAEFAAYEALVAAFEAKHPEIDIELRHVPGQGQYRQRLATEFSAGAPPDVMLLNYRRFATFAAQGGIEPLGPYLEQSELIAADDFFDIAIDSFRWDGQLWCVPQNISSLVVYYNQALFDAAGVAYPADDWTRADFLAAAQALTDAEQNQYGVGLSPQIFRLAPFLWQDGLELVDDRSNPTRLTLTSAEALATFQWFVDLQTVHGVVPDFEAETAESSQSRFLNGRLAMIFNSRRGVPTYRTIESFGWDVAPLPRGKQSAGILHSDAYCMSQRTADKDGAWTFIEFANSVEGQSIVAVSGRTVPSLRAVAADSVFLDPTKPPANARIYVDTVPILGAVPIMDGWVGVEETANGEVERAFYGQATVAEAAASAEALTQRFFDEQRR